MMDPLHVLHPTCYIQYLDNFLILHSPPWASIKDRVVAISATIVAVTTSASLLWGLVEKFVISL